MAWFGRSARKGREEAAGTGTGESPDAGTPEQPTSADDAGSEPRSTGPWDQSEVEDRGSRIDMGSLWIPGIDGMQLRMEVDKKTEQITGAAIIVEASALQIQAFAAPRTEGIWDEIREEIEESLAKQGATVDDIVGPWGRELLAQVDATDPKGAKVRRVIRFVGVDGPRWFVRGVITGNAATDPEAAKKLEDLLADVVVLRDQVPRAPRDILALSMPQVAPRPGSATPTSEEASDSDQVAPDFDPLKRGPEITEIR